VTFEEWFRLSESPINQAAGESLTAETVPPQISCWACHWAHALVVVGERVAPCVEAPSGKAAGESLRSEMVPND
jgi:hypothetical protein